MDRSLSLWTVERQADHGLEMCNDSVRAWWSGVQVQFSIKTIGPLDRRLATIRPKPRTPRGRDRAHGDRSAGNDVEAISVDGRVLRERLRTAVDARRPGGAESPS